MAGMNTLGMWLRPAKRNLKIETIESFAWCVKIISAQIILMPKGAGLGPIECRVVVGPIIYRGKVISSAAYAWLKQGWRMAGSRRGAAKVRVRGEFDRRCARVWANKS